MRILGIDGGIASAGWCLADVDGDGQYGAVLGLGTWMFTPPEERTQTGTKLKSAQRRLHRGQRRVVRRRRQRMGNIRRLFADAGLLPDAHRDALKCPGLDPWRLRVAGLERRLSPLELAVALGHIARHRGFRSNAKGAAGAGANAPDDDKKMLKAAAETRAKLARYGSPARMMLEDEARAILRTQRRLGSPDASDAFEADYAALAFDQRSLQDSEALVGTCPFEKGVTRAAKATPSYELFRLAQRLTTLRILDGAAGRRLRADEMTRALSDIGVQAGYSFATLRRTLGLAESLTFEGVKPEEENKRDVVSRSGRAMAATHAFRKVIAGPHGEMTWQALWRERTALDAAAAILTFRNDPARIREGLEEIPGLAPEIRDTLLAAAAADGAFDSFAGAAHLSAPALRAILPGLLAGDSYDVACAQAGYDHTDSVERHAFATGATGKDALARILKEERITRELVGSPTARKAIIEILKQVKAVIEIHGLPDRIHIELARDLGKSIEERERIDKGIRRRTGEKDALRAEFALPDMIGRPPRDGTDDLLKFELWKRQNGHCLYTDHEDGYISPELIGRGDAAVQIDHILPWGRFGDDSFHNKVLCLAKANQDKRDRTPYEWIHTDQGEQAWQAFVARVEGCATLKGLTKRNLTLRNADEKAGRFRDRNLNDTRWTCRLLAEALRQVLPDIVDADGKTRRRVLVRPGALTDRLRRAWGLNWLKKDADGNRLSDDRHHALDALIVAATSESLLNRATRAVQEIEARGLPYDLPKAFAQALPWPTFTEDARTAVEGVFVARAERARARGAAHEATLRQVRERDGQTVVFEKKAVNALTLKDLDRLKDPERNHRTLAALRAWIEAGKPKDSPPRSPQGDVMRQVRLETPKKKRTDLIVRKGQVDRGEMVRVDVFRKTSPKGNPLFRFIPIYADQFVKDVPPNRAITIKKDLNKWEVIDDSWEFLWSIHKLSYLLITDDQGIDCDGYFKGINSNDACIVLCKHENTSKQGETGKIGTRKLQNIRKFKVNRMGERHEVKREPRIWRGKVCT